MLQISCDDAIPLILFSLTRQKAITYKLTMTFSNPNNQKRGALQANSPRKTQVLRMRKIQSP